MITIDDYIINIIQREKYKEKQYPLYFAPEIAGNDKSQISDEVYNEDPEKFEENRKNGENTDEIAVIIQKDLIDEFITYVNQKDYSLNSTIKKSLFETNSYLVEKFPTLIEYASFYGSTQIFKYLYKNGVKLTSSLWIYAIHSDCAELISILEENHFEPKDKTYCECFIESIKCHHNKMALYIMDNYITDKSILNNKNLFFKYYNFQFIECNDMDTKSLFFIACKYNYVYIVKILLDTTDIDVNSITNEFSVSEPLFDLKSLMRPDYKIKKLKTPLLLAVEKGNIDIVQLLLANEKIDVNLPERWFSNEDECRREFSNDRKYRLFNSSNCPLTIAIEKGYIEIAKHLLSHPQIDVNCKHLIEDCDNDNMNIKSALILAIQFNELDIVKLLLANPKIDVNARSINKIPYDSQYIEKTPLCFAIRSENIEIVKEILGSDDIDLNSPQVISIVYPYEEDDDTTSKIFKSALSLAIDKNNAEIVKLLISHPNFSLKDQSYKRFDYMSKISSFIEYKMGGGWSYIMPLMKKVMNNSIYDFKLLKKVNKPALCYAIKNKKYDIVNVILSSEQSNVNDEITKSKYTIKKDEYDSSNRNRWVWSKEPKTKNPALCIAVKNNDVEMVKLLLSSPKINVNIECVKESYSYKNEEEEEEEEDKNEKEKEIEWIHKKEINSPLLIAVKNSRSDITLGFHFDVENPIIKIIKLLLQNKEIDLNKVDDQNKKAIDYADDEVKKLFQEFK